VSVAAAYVSREREKIEVHKFGLLATVLIPLLAVFLQAFVSSKVSFFEEFDLPLLVVIFFAVARRDPVSGLFTGAAIGLLQDALTHHPIGIHGIAKTVVGYVASSIGVRIDVENPGSRLLLVFGFYLLHWGVYFAVARGLVGEAIAPVWGHKLLLAIANALLAVVLFAFLDRFKQRG